MLLHCHNSKEYFSSSADPRGVQLYPNTLPRTRACNNKRGTDIHSMPVGCLGRQVFHTAVDRRLNLLSGFLETLAEVCKALVDGSFKLVLLLCESGKALDVRAAECSPDCWSACCCAFSIECAHGNLTHSRLS